MSAPIQLSRKKFENEPLSLWEGLNEFLAFADVLKLSPVQRVAHLAYSYSIHVEMAGHEDYFSASSQADYLEVIASLRTIGAIQQAEILEAALSAVDSAGKLAPQDYAQIDSLPVFSPQN